MQRLLYIDPDQGWRYGFPKIISSDLYFCQSFIIDEWLIEHGYPKKFVEYWNKRGFPSVPFTITYES